MCFAYSNVVQNYVRENYFIGENSLYVEVLINLLEKELNILR